MPLLVGVCNRGGGGRAASQLVRTGFGEQRRPAPRGTSRSASPIALATRDTLRALRDPDRRPPQRQVPLPEGLRDNLPAPLALCQKRFLQNVRGSRRGAAAGPPGCTAEALRVLVDDEAKKKKKKTRRPAQSSCSAPRNSSRLPRCRRPCLRACAWAGWCAAWS